MSAFELFILGSNSAVPAHGRNPSAQILKHKSCSILIDCGEGTQFQMNRYHIKRANLDYILISHMHGDHYFGLVGLLNSMRLNGRTRELQIYGPPELDPIIRLQTHYDEGDWSFQINFHALEFGKFQVIFESADLIVSSLPLKHKLPCNGFLFKEKPKLRTIIPEALEKFAVPNSEIFKIKQGSDFINSKGETILNQVLSKEAKASFSYAYCSDTIYDEDLLAYIAGVDLLYHEATFLKEDEEKAALRYHSTTWQAASIAKQAEVGHLLIGHFSAKYKDLSSYLIEAQEIFSDTSLALEGNAYAIPYLVGQ
ncbi:MAG: ribonuclease Z [Chitinophagales bacterium]|nr:ribonuclease Z [Chitinophagales bacterium]